MRACTHLEINHNTPYRRGQLIRGESISVPLMTGKLVEVGIGDYLTKPRGPESRDDLFDVESQEFESGASHTNLVSIADSDDEALRSRRNSDSSVTVPGDEAHPAPKVSPISTRCNGDGFNTTGGRPVLQDEKWGSSSLEQMMILALRTLDGADGMPSPRSVDSSEDIIYMNACSPSMFSCWDGDSVEDDDDPIVIHCMIWKRIGGLSFNHLSNTSTKTFGVCSQDLRCLKRLGATIDEDLDPNSFRVMTFSVRIFRHRYVPRATMSWIPGRCHGMPQRHQSPPTLLHSCTKDICCGALHVQLLPLSCGAMSFCGTVYL